jgi:hypothetical protein
VFIIASLGGPEDLLGVRLAYCAFVLLGYGGTLIQRFKGTAYLRYYLRNNSQIASLTIESSDYTTTCFNYRPLWIEIAEPNHFPNFLCKRSFVKCIIKILVIFLFQFVQLALCESTENPGILTSSRNITWLIANIISKLSMEWPCFGARLEK